MERAPLPAKAGRGSRSRRLTHAPLQHAVVRCDDIAGRSHNGHTPEAHSFEERDVTRYLQAAGDSGQRFDLVVVDPPAFARSHAKTERALHAYEQLNALAARVVAADGLMLTCSCSGAVNAAEFENTVRGGLLRAGRSAQLIEVFGPALDHPTLPGFPEDRYLKALLLRLV